MPIKPYNLSLNRLSERELAQVENALDLLDAALNMLLERGAVDEQDGIDLVELSDALALELKAREAVSQ